MLRRRTRFRLSRSADRSMYVKHAPRRLSVNPSFPEIEIARRFRKEVPEHSQTFAYHPHHTGEPRREGRTGSFMSCTVVSRPKRNVGSAISGRRDPGGCRVSGRSALLDVQKGEVFTTLLRLRASQGGKRTDVDSAGENRRRGRVPWWTLVALVMVLSVPNRLVKGCRSPTLRNAFPRLTSPSQ